MMRVAVSIGVVVAGFGVAAMGAPPRGTGTGVWQERSRLLDPETFQRVDQTYGDIDPLRMSLRNLGVDLRVSGGGFSSDVYRIPGERGDGSDDRFARRSGGTIAVFPQSIYSSTQNGVIAEIPPGTVFYLDGVPAARPWDHGGMGPRMVRGGPAGATGQRVDSALELSVGAGTSAGEAGAGGEGATGAVLYAEEGAGLFLGARRLLMRAAGEGRD